MQPFLLITCVQRNTPPTNSKVMTKRKPPDERFSFFLLYPAAGVMQEAVSAGIPVPGGACEDTSRIMTFRYAAKKNRQPAGFLRAAGSCVKVPSLPASLRTQKQTPDIRIYLSYGFFEGLSDDPHSIRRTYFIGAGFDECYCLFKRLDSSGGLDSYMFAHIFFYQSYHFGICSTRTMYLQALPRNSRR